MSTITVRPHFRRRVGKTAKLAAKLGFGTDVKIEPYRRRRPGTLYRHQDDGTLCGNVIIEKHGMVHRNTCPHGREIESV